MVNIVSIDECLKHVNNRFELILIASRRARNISMKNEKPMVESLNEKSTVIALMEIEKGCSSDLYFNKE